MGCTAYGDTIILQPHYQAEESFQMIDSSLRLVDKWAEIWEPLTMEFPEMTLPEIPKILESLKKIKVNDLKPRLETIDKASPSQKWVSSWCNG